MINLDKAINSLPLEAQRQVIDFIEFIIKKYSALPFNDSLSEKYYWLKLNEEALNKIWNNEEDDVYNELLKR